MISVLPGVALTLVIASLAQGLAALAQPLPVSPMLLAIVIGLALAPWLGRMPRWQAGLALSRGSLLRAAVALLGLQLSLTQLSQLGAQALPLVVAVVIGGLVVVMGLSRLLGVNSRLAVLLAVGTSICGASAIAATAPGLKAPQREVAYAMACVAVIGLMATLAYGPLLVAGLDPDPSRLGLLLGAVIHDTAQVSAAALLMSQTTGEPGILEAAMVSKLLRNSTMLVVIPAMLWWFHRHQADTEVRRPALPLFILGFIALSALRSGGDALWPELSLWAPTIEWAGVVSRWGLTMAMAAIALNLTVSELKPLGWRGFVVAVLAAVLLLGVSVMWLLLA
jgi:uncharacterized integral membrane protein (TIGR00698 family)